MKLFTQHLSPESLAALQILEKSTIQSIISESCDINIGSSILTVQSISIQVNSECFIIIKNDWADTPLQAIDYYFLSADISSSPKNIFYEPNRERLGYNYKNDHTILHLGSERRIAQIEILEDYQKESLEEVQYDAGILITLFDGLQIAIVREQSITGFLEIAHTMEDIKRLTSELKVRLTPRFQHDQFHIHRTII
jgi:hypothetical protein